MKVKNTPKRMPKGSWMYRDSKNNWRYTPFWILVNKLAAEYDNSALEQGRMYKDYILKKVQRDLIELDVEFIPSIGSLKVCCNAQRTNLGVYNQTDVVKDNRNKILNKIKK